MQWALNEVQTWCRADEISINPNKNKYVLFTMRTKVEGFAEPTQLNTVLHTTRSVGYSGCEVVLEGAGSVNPTLPFCYVVGLLVMT